MTSKPYDIFSQVPPHLRDMGLYKKTDPQIVFGQTILSMQIPLIANAAAVKIVTAERPKAYMLTNITADNIFFIGGEGVTIQSGFPINSFERLVFGLMENTHLWAVSTVNITVYVMDLGL